MGSGEIGKRKSSSPCANPCLPIWGLKGANMPWITFAKWKELMDAKGEMSSVQNGTGGMGRGRRALRIPWVLRKQHLQCSSRPMDVREHGADELNGTLRTEEEGE